MKSKVPFVSILLNLITIPILLFFLIFYDIPHQAVEKVYYWFKYETSHVPPKEISCENIPTEKLMVAATQDELEDFHAVKDAVTAYGSG